jgi:allophanate hydrolase subunit 2
MTMGSVQILASRQPVVITADGPISGGHPKIVNVTHANLLLLAPCEARKSRMRSRETIEELTQTKYRKLFKGLQMGVVSEDEK